MLKRILQHLLSEDEFLSAYGVRSVSRIHAEQPRSRHAARHRPGADRVRARRIELGPVRRQLQLARADLDADQLHAGAGDREVPSLPRRRLQGPGAVPRRRELTLKEIATLISERLVNIFRRGADGRIPALPRRQPVPARSALAGPAAVQRVLPRRHRSGLGRDAPDRLDRAGRQPGAAPLPRGYSDVLEETQRSAETARRERAIGSKARGRVGLRPPSSGEGRGEGDGQDRKGMRSCPLSLALSHEGRGELFWQ